jgi:PAS domain-containing protein
MMETVDMADLHGGITGLSAAGFFEGSPVPTFVIDANHIVTHFNKACAITLGVRAEDVIGTRRLGHIFYGHDRPVMADLIVDGAMKEIIDDLYQNKYRGSLVVPDAYEAEGHFPIWVPRADGCFSPRPHYATPAARLSGPLKHCKTLPSAR